MISVCSLASYAQLLLYNKTPSDSRVPFSVPQKPIGYSSLVNVNFAFYEFNTRVCSPKIYTCVVLTLPTYVSPVLS